MSTIQAIHRHEVQLCYEGEKKGTWLSFFFFQLPLKKNPTNQSCAPWAYSSPSPQSWVMCDDDDAKLSLSTAHCDTLCLCLVPAPSHFTETTVVVFCCIVLMKRELSSSRSLCVPKNNSPYGLFWFFLFGIDGWVANELAR